MLSIFVEASCNRYSRDECVDCHVFEPLIDIPKSDWHMTPDQALIMAEKIKSIDVLNKLAQQEINLTGGEATQNPNSKTRWQGRYHIVPHCLGKVSKTTSKRIVNITKPDDR